MSLEDRVKAIEDWIKKHDEEEEANPIRKGRRIMHEGKWYRVKVMPHIRWRTPEGKEVLAITLEEE